MHQYTEFEDMKKDIVRNVGMTAVRMLKEVEVMKKMMIKLKATKNGEEFLEVIKEFDSELTSIGFEYIAFDSRNLR